MSDWDEIRRLAADLQRAQLSSSVQRLSERNCIEIVSRLVGTGLLEVLHTADGKEYLTPQQLQREIRDELAVSRGRASLVDLAAALNVDYSHAEEQGQAVARQDGGRTHLVLGQLVSSDYLDSLCEQVNEGLQLNGTVTISALTKEYDLPSEFLQDEIGKRLGKIIEGYRDAQDPKIIITPSYAQRNRAKIRGALSAITVPTSVQDILNRFKIEEHMFFSLAEELIHTKRVRGSLTGGKRASKATFVPAVFSRAQTRWVDDFLAQNGYVEYEAVGRLGISDPAGFLKKRFAGRKDIHFLSSCCLGSGCLNLVESSLEEAVAASGSWIDVVPLLPSVLSLEDSAQVLQIILSRTSVPADVFANSVAVSRGLIEKLEQTFQDLIPEKAKADLASKKYEALLNSMAGGGSASISMEEEKVDKKEERRKKAASGKAGGGAQGRETKTKSTKKKGGNKRRGGDWSDDSEDEAPQHNKGKGGKGKGKGGGGGGATSAAKIELLSLPELEAKISTVNQLDDCPEDVYSELAARFYPPLTQKYREALLELHRSTMAASLHDRSKAHSELQDKCNSVISHVKLFQKGAAAFEGQERKGLERHLLKTQCAELANLLFAYHAQERAARETRQGGGEETPASAVNASSMTADDRVKVVKTVGKEEGEALLAIHKALAGDDVAAFIEVFEENSQSACDVFIRKSDKKKDRQLVFAHRHSLLERLQTCQEPALALHLALTVVFQTQVAGGAMLHASGKFVPQILAHVAPSMEEEDAELLQKFQGLVVKQASAGEEGDEGAAEELREMLPKLREVAASKRRNSTSKD